MGPLQFVIISSSIALLYATDYETPKWMKPSRIESFQKTFYDLLDHNNDGNVTKTELAIGILAQIDSQNIAENAQEFISFIPTQYSCVPSLDFVDFADCLSIQARKEFVSAKTNPDAIISFEESLDSYFGECADITPPKFSGQYCEDLIQNDPYLCHEYPSYCSVSCYQCKEHKSQIRGTNNVFHPRPEKPVSIKLHSTIKSMTPLTGIGAIKGLESLNVNAANCTDIPPSSQYTCEQQKEYGKCDASWMVGYCCKTCFDCAASCTGGGGGDTCDAVKPTSHSGKILFVSDIHVEPWYNIDGSGEVSRFSGANSGNMFECRNSKGSQVNCELNGGSDPPFPLYSTGIDFLRQHASTSRMLIFGGDTQAHSYTSGVSSPLTSTVPDLLSPIVKYMLKDFAAANILYAAGNNDGQHDEIFCSGSDSKVNAAWANVLTSERIVTNDLNRRYNVSGKSYSQTELFDETGYYLKKMPAIFTSSQNENFYAIVLNTNLGTGNSRQNAVFNEDLAWIKRQSNGHVVIVGHHPNVVTAIIPSEYQSMVAGAFSGHVHYFQPSNSKDFAILPPITQYSSYVGVMTANMNSGGKIVLEWDNFNQYLGAKHKVPAEDCWGYDGKP